jgi:hypothetical protein
LEAAEAETANEAQKLKQQKDAVWVLLLHVLAAASLLRCA